MCYVQTLDPAYENITYLNFGYDLAISFVRLHHFLDIDNERHTRMFLFHFVKFSWPSNRSRPSLQESATAFPD